jgi:putative thiamine transport system permease protein
MADPIRAVAADSLSGRAAPRPADPAAPPGRRAGRLLAAVPVLTLVLFLTPIAVGLLGTWIPAFGYLPALGGTEAGLAPWRALFESPGLPGAVRLTLVTGFLSTALALALSLGLCAAWHGSRTMAAARRALAPLLAVPHAALAIGLMFLLSGSGWLARGVAAGSGALGLPVWERPPAFGLVQDPWGLALTFGLVLKETPFLLLMIVAASGQVRIGRTLAVARTAGYGPVTAWIKTVLPQIYPQIRLPVYAVLAYSLSVVDMALILGPSTPPPLAPLVLRWFNDPDLTMRFVAAAGACLQLLIVVAGIAAWYGAERLVARVARPWLSGGRRGGSGTVARAATGGGMALALAAAAVSLAALAVWSLAWRWRYPDLVPSAWTLGTWERNLSALAWPAWTTLGVGLAATVIALVLTVACLEYEQRAGVRPTTRALWLLYTPLLVPQIGFLFGMQVLLVVLRLDGTWPALVWSHLLFVLPYVFLALAEPWRALDERYIRTAACLGAPPWRVFWRIKLPMLLRPVLIAAAIGFAVSVAQYLPTLFAGAGRLTTLTTEAVGLAGGADRRVIAVYAFAQMSLPLIGFAVALAVPALLFRHRQGMRQ